MKPFFVPVFFIAIASQLAAAISPETIFETAHVNVTTYAHDINVFASTGQPDASSGQLHADAEAAIQQLELSIVEFTDNGPFSAADSATLEAIANNTEETMSDLCRAILVNILPTADSHITNLLTADISALSTVFDNALATLEPLVTASVKAQIVTIKSNLEAVCPT